jgi:hypothetical protein
VLRRSTFVCGSKSRSLLPPPIKSLEKIFSR